MFRKLWQALDNVAKSFNDLATSVSEANSNFREHLGLDDKDGPEQLSYEPAAETTPSNGRRRSAAK